MSESKNRLSGNRGFSLIELLVAVMILGIVASPLLHAMVTSARTAARSRELQNETMAAQNVVEYIGALEVSTVLESIYDYNTGVIGDPGVLKSLCSDAGLYTYDALHTTYDEIALGDYPAYAAFGKDFYQIGLKNLPFASGAYDAMVTLDASAYPAINNKSISVYTGMNAVFSQPENDGATLYNPDSQAAADFAAKAFLLSGETVDFTHRLTRTIDIRITKTGSNVTATAEYSYSSKYTYTVPAVLDGSGTVITPAYDVTEVLPPFSVSPYYFYTGTTEDFSSVHFFYYPNYNTLPSSVTSADGVYDLVTIHNDSGLPFTFFLIKQFTPGYSSTDINMYENDYEGKLALMEPWDAQRMIEGRTIASVYTNMNVILGQDLDLLNSSLLLFYNGRWFNYGSSTGTLVANEKLKRLFAITVALYPAGAGFTGTPEYTFTASEVD